MDSQSFDNLTQNVAGRVSRRASLATLSAAGLAAILAAPFTVEAKKGGKKKKKKQNPVSPPPVATPAPDLCAGQAEECSALLSNICGGNPECQDSIDCCSFLGTCDVGSFVVCLNASF
jgi:hypothetical protein